MHVSAEIFSVEILLPDPNLPLMGVKGCYIYAYAKAYKWPLQHPEAPHAEVPHSWMLVHNPEPPETQRSLSQANGHL